jgi:hypothetical protein
MERKLYSVYSAIQYSSKELGDFFAVKNLVDLHTEDKEIIGIEQVLYRHHILQSSDLNQYCFVPGDSATVEPNIICFTDFYLVYISSLEIVGKIKTYPEPNTGLNNFLILCDIPYAREHGWLNEE